MKLKFSVFDQKMAFDKSSGFAKKIISPKTGSVFAVSTKPNDSTVRVCYSIKGPKPKGQEQVLTIPLHDQTYAVMIDKNTQSHYISIGGKRPKTLISIRGPRPKPKPADQDALIVKLESKQGGWLVKPDSTGEVLNISFNGPKQGGPPPVK